jgi:hypothetical protein
MKPNALPKDATALLALARDIATLLSEREMELGIDVEVFLRAGIGAAIYACAAYLAVRDGATQPPRAQRILIPAEDRCDRALQQLHDRVRRSTIATICRFMDVDELQNIAEQMLSISE